MDAAPLREPASGRHGRRPRAPGPGAKRTRAGARPAKRAQPGRPAMGPDPSTLTRPPARATPATSGGKTPAGAPGGGAPDRRAEGHNLGPERRPRLPPPSVLGAAGPERSGPTLPSQMAGRRPTCRYSGMRPAHAGRRAFMGRGWGGARRRPVRPGTPGSGPAAGTPGGIIRNPGSNRTVRPGISAGAVLSWGGESAGSRSRRRGPSAWAWAWAWAWVVGDWGLASRFSRCAREKGDSVSSHLRGT
jgi:hypothetical protein